MKHYRQLTQEERYQIAALMETGLGKQAIARRLDRSPSTISREVGRNSGIKSYWAASAQRLSDTRRKTASKANKRIPELIDWVTERLKENRDLFVLT